MQLRLTVIDSTSSAAPVDCLVEMPSGGVLGDVRADLLHAVGRSDGRLFCANEPLAGETRIGAPPLLDGAVLTVDQPRGRAPATTLELHVTGGPDSGTVHPLGPGEHCIGRALEATVRIDDPDVSRLHAVLRVGDGAVTLADLGSTNGTTVDGMPVGRTGAPFSSGEVLQVGGSRLELVAPARARAACRADGEGRLQLNRPPRLAPPASTSSVTLPAEPTPREGARLPVIALAVPLVAGLGLVAFTGNPTYLVFVLLSPLMVLSTFLSDRVGGRRTARAQRREYDGALADARARIAAAVRAEESARHGAHPGAASVLQAAKGPTPRLWERRGHDHDFLSVRVGLADLPADVEVREDGDRPSERPVARSVPVTVALTDVAVMGFAGARAGMLANARFALAQLAAWHSPRHLGIVVLVADQGGADWDWVRWLPHLQPRGGEDTELLVGLDADQIRHRVAELVALLDVRADQTGWSAQPWNGRSVVVVLDGARELRRVPGVARLLADGPAGGVYVLCLDEHPVALPVECGATVEVVGETDTTLRVTVRDCAAVDSVVMDGVSETWAHGVARALAPLDDATPDDTTAELPTDARLLDLLSFDATDAAALETAWRVSPRTTDVLLGVSVDDRPFVVDLQRDGPHALVAGTTGAGKSELLQALVAGLAVGNRPDELAFVLIDYKGGAAFKDCARLPHTVGTVTDLDGHLTERALASLGAELRRRETVLRDAGCKDIDDYVSSGSRDGTSLPRLVLVVDEFATLAEELPDFVGGLVGIAQRGRSLGVHLVLATQRPSGVVSADIRANTTMRIALRVTDPAESTDVVDAKDAASISRTTPGRAVARIGAGAVMPFQSARVGACAPIATPGPRIRTMRWADAGAVRSRAASAGGSGPTDLSRLVDAARDAAANLAIAPIPSPWLPPLRAQIPLAGLPNVPGAATVPYGLLDLPVQQRRAPLVLDLEQGGHLLVAGGPRSGRSTMLHTMAGSMAARLGPSDAHLYVIEGGGAGLTGLASLPHCGAVVGRDQVTRGDRVLARLVEEVERRQSLLAAGSFGSLAEQRAAAEPQDRLPWMVLMVDGWEGFHSAYDELDHGRPLDVLHRLVREGGAVGLRVVLAGDRSLLTSRIGSAISDRVLLRLADPGDYGLAGVPARQVPVSMPAGRGLLADTCVEAQVALLDPDPAGPVQRAALAVIAASCPAVDPETPRHQRPLRVEPLPAQVPVDAVKVAAKAAATGPLWTLVGVGGDDLDALGVDLDEEPGFVIAGPAGSGRSTALLTMARWLGHEGVATVVVATARSPLSALTGEPGVRAVVRPDESEHLSHVLATCGRPFVVLADDAELLHDSPVERPLCELLRPHGTRTGVVLAGSSSEMSGFFRGLTVEARRNRCGLLLGPVGPVDGDLLGVRVARGGEARPGRGLLVVRGRVQPVQVATSAAP